MSEQSSGFVDTFLSKLKEQSFIIILMLGGLYYQNKVFDDQLDRYKQLVDEKQKYIGVFRHLGRNEQSQF